MNEARSPKPLHTVAIISGRQPFELMFLAACTMVGLVMIFTPDRPESVRAAMPVVVQYLWEFGILASGVIGLIALAMQGREVYRGLAVEMAAMILGCTVLSMYGTAMFMVAGPRALAAGAFVGAFALGTGVRAAQIFRDLRAFTREVVD